MSLYKTTPRVHQAASLIQMDGQTDFALLAGIGSGKSKTILDDAAREFRRGTIDTLVVMAPIGVHNDAWVGDARDPGLISQHLPDDIDRVVAYTRSGKLNAGLNDVLAAADSTRVLKIACVHYEALSAGSAAATVLSLVKRARGGVMILGDESQKFRTPSANRTQLIWKLGEMARFGRITTGSPTSQGWQDLYAQYRFLHWSIIGCATYSEFKARFCVETEHEHFKSITGYHHLDELQRLIAPYTYQINLADCTDLPERVYVERTVALSPAQKAAYKTLEETLMLELDNGQILETDLAVTKILRLQQIVAGHLPDLEGGWTMLGETNPRVEAAVDVVRQADGKVIIWCRFIPDRQLLAAALNKEGIGFAVYAGADRSVELAKWRSQDDCRVLIANPVSGGTGLTLNESTTMIHYSQSFNFEDLEQSEGRNYRIGQDKKTVVVTLRAKGTTDDRVWRTLRGKKNIADALRSSDAIRRFIRE